jgi:hypothetical protein
VLTYQRLGTILPRSPSEAVDPIRTAADHILSPGRSLACRIQDTS